jgi:hypothetical protein
MTPINSFEFNDTPITSDDTEHKPSLFILFLDFLKSFWIFNTEDNNSELCDLEEEYTTVDEYISNDENTSDEEYTPDDEHVSDEEYTSDDEHTSDDEYNNDITYRICKNAILDYSLKYHYENEEPTIYNSESEEEQNNEIEEINDEYYMEDMRSITHRFYIYGKNTIDNCTCNYTKISAKSMMSPTSLVCTRYLVKYKEKYYDIIFNGKNAKVITIVDF